MMNFNNMKSIHIKKEDKDMMNFNNMNENYEVINTFCRMYRKELTIIGGYLSQSLGITTIEEYKRFFDSLNIETFIGNYLTSLCNPDAIDNYKEILNGETSIEEFIIDCFGEEASEEIFKYL